jgi:endoglucanase
VSDGTVSGGPNSAIQDPVAQQAWPDGCVAQLCYLDDIQSWSTNEMTVNWNSALSWVSSWVAIHADDAGPTGSSAGEAAGGMPVWLVVLLAVLGLAVIAVVAVLLLRRRRA